MPVDLSLGTVIGSTERASVSTAMFEATDRLEAQRWDGTDEFLVATGGDELIDDIAYVATFVLNRTFCRKHDLVHRLVHAEGLSGRRHTAASLFPRLFEPAQVVQPAEWDELEAFMADLVGLEREDFARVMRVVRTTVDATRTAIDDPTGAYTDMVAALESLGDDAVTSPATWDRYDPNKRKIIDAALDGADDDVAERVRNGVLEADRAGLKRRFVASTLARVSRTYYREEAIDSVRPPSGPQLERMLSVAYDIRSRRSHVLQDLGGEAWVFTDGAETTFDAKFDRILTLAGLWRLTRHVVLRVVSDAPKAQPEPWDYRGALPGQFQAQLAPQYWIWQAEAFDAESAPRWFNGVAEATISWLSGENKDGFNLTRVIDKIEHLVPGMPDGEAKTAMIAIHVLWHEWLRPEDRSTTADEFNNQYGSCLNLPTPSAFAVFVLSNRRQPNWTADEWAAMASNRHTARLTGNEAPLPATIDALIQLKAADQLHLAGRHEEAIIFAANAVEERPGDANLVAWESGFLIGDHDRDFDVRHFLLGNGQNANRDDNIAPETTDEPSTE